MQAVLSLCYFCETHGPRVLMTTQSISESLRQDYCLPTTSKPSPTFVSASGFFIFRHHLLCENEIKPFKLALTLQNFTLSFMFH